MIDYLDCSNWQRYMEDDRAAAAARELRRAPRTDIVGEATLLPTGPTLRARGDLTVELRDVSWFGVGFTSSVALEPNTRWRVGFLDGAKLLREHLVSVRHCRPHGSGYLAGAQFCVDPDILEGLGASRARLAPM